MRHNSFVEEKPGSEGENDVKNFLIDMSPAIAVIMLHPELSAGE